MNNDAIYQRFVALINKFNSFSIALPINPTVDTVAAAISLYVGLTKSGKNVSMACSSDIPPTYGITGSDKIQKSLATGGDNLIISFPYSDGSIDKVTYNIEGAFFNLNIQPREGYEKLDPSQVKYTYAGGKVDVIIVIDAPTLNSLGELYTANQDQFKGKDIVNIDRHLTNGNFGTVNLLEKKMSSTCEIVMRLVGYINIAIDKDLATTLYNGIVAATNNFSSYSVNPDTFEASAYLLKNGAVKKAPMRANPVGMTGNPTPMRQPYSSMNQPFNAYQQSRPMPGAMPPPAPAFDNSEGFDEEEDVMFQPQAPQPQPITPIRQPITQPSMQPNGMNNGQSSINQYPQAASQQIQQPKQSMISTPQIEAIRQDIKKVENKEVKPQEDEIDTNTKPAPKEWLKPKIFRGSNLV